MINLSHTYDAVGNVLTIADANAGGTQTQTFTYDALDRMITAAASRGSGGTYNQAYAYNTIGNVTWTDSGGNYAYGTSVTGCTTGTLLKPQAASGYSTYSYAYDCNGNMISRSIGSSYGLSYDAENHLTAISGAATASYVYDGDGQLVKSTSGGATTVYLGTYYEWNGSAGVKYYYAGSQRVAMRDASGTLYFILGDHLGSTSKVATATGAFYREVRYANAALPTNFRFTGKREETVSGSLTDFGARWYDAGLKR